MKASSFILLSILLTGCLFQNDLKNYVVNYQPSNEFRYYKWVDPENELIFFIEAVKYDTSGKYNTLTSMAYDPQMDKIKSIKKEIIDEEGIKLFKHKQLEYNHYWKVDDSLVSKVISSNEYILKWDMSKGDKSIITTNAKRNDSLNVSKLEYELIEKRNIRYKNEAVEAWKVSKTLNQKYFKEDSLIYEYIPSVVFFYYALNTGLFLIEGTTIFNSTQEFELEGIYDSYAEAIEE